MIVFLYRVAIRLLHWPTLQPVSLFPKHKFVAAAENEIRSHDLFLTAARNRAKFIHQLNLLAHRLPECLTGIGLDPLTINLWLSRPTFVQTATYFAVDPITRKNCRDEFADGTASRHGLQMTNIGLRYRALGHRVQLLSRKSQGFAKTRVKTALHFDRAQRVTGEQFQRFEIRRFGAALAKNLRKIEQINVVLENEVDEAIHRQAAGVKLTEERVIFDRSPDAIAVRPQLRAEVFGHRLALAKFPNQGKWQVVASLFFFRVCKFRTIACAESRDFRMLRRLVMYIGVTSKLKVHAAPLRKKTRFKFQTGLSGQTELCPVKLP